MDEFEPLLGEWHGEGDMCENGVRKITYRDGDGNETGFGPAQ